MARFMLKFRRATMSLLEMSELEGLVGRIANIDHLRKRLFWLFRCSRGIANTVI